MDQLPHWEPRWASSDVCWCRSKTTTEKNPTMQCFSLAPEVTVINHSHAVWHLQQWDKIMIHESLKPRCTIHCRVPYEGLSRRMFAVDNTYFALGPVTVQTLHWFDSRREKKSVNRGIISFTAVLQFITCRASSGVFTVCCVRLAVIIAMMRGAEESEDCLAHGFMVTFKYTTQNEADKILHLSCNSTKRGHYTSTSENAHFSSNLSYKHADQSLNWSVTELFKLEPELSLVHPLYLIQVAQSKERASGGVHGIRWTLTSVSGQ